MSIDRLNREAEASAQVGFCPYCMSRVPPGECCPVCGLTRGAYTPSPHHLPPGIILSRRYLVGRVLGEGGFGITYIGCDLRLEVKVAIKEYFPIDRVSRYADSSLDVITRTGQGDRNYGQGLKRFLYEARTMARMEKQPQIVTVRDYFEANNTAYIVMEYVEGTDFKELVNQRGGSIPAQELLPLIEPLFSALSAVHEAGLIHRDISPDNLMLERGQVRLLDFGCARESRRGTETLTVALKQGFAPIEQYQNNGQGPWTDVYALSAVIYYCLTGRVPPQSLERILEDELIPPRRLGADLTPGQERALLKGLRIQPRKRYQTVEELHTGLYFPTEPDDATASELPDRDYMPKEMSSGAEEIEPTTAVPTAEVEKPEQLFEMNEPDRTDMEKEAVKPIDSAQTPIDKSLLACLLLCGAAALLAVVLFFINPADGTGGQDAAGSAPLAPFAVPPGDAAIVNDFDELQAALTDENVAAIRLMNVVEWWDEPLEIAKPLFIEAEGALNSYQAVTIVEGGSIELLGDLSVSCGLLRTAGGTVHVGEGGWLQAWQLWLEDETDLSLYPGSGLDLYGTDTITDNTHCTIFSEDQFAQYGVRVTSFDELLNELNRAHPAPIIIGSGTEIAVSEGVYVNCPILIEEGASVTMPVDDLDNFHFYFAEGGTLVNRGSFEGSIIGDLEAGDIFNYGEIKGRIYWDSEGMAYNLGTIQTTESAILRGGLVNLDNLICTEAGEGWNDYRENNLLNYGVLTLSGRPEFGASLTTNYRLVNAGRIEIGSHADLTNYGHIENFGEIVLTDPEARFCNEGTVLTTYEKSSILLPEGGHLYGNGWFLHSGQLDELLDDMDDTLAALNISHGENTRTVTNPVDLKIALDSDAVDTVVIAEPIKVSGDLMIGKPVLCFAPFHTSGTLTVTGGGMVYADCEKLTGGNLVANEDSLVMCFGNFNFDTVALSNGGRLCAAPYGAVEIGEALTIEGSIFTVLSGLYMEDADVDILSGGRVLACGPLELPGCRVNVEREGAIYSFAEDFLLDEASVLENRGSIDYMDTHGLHTIDLNGTVQNAGELRVYANSLHVSGTFANEGTIRADQSIIVTGILDNQGRVILYDPNDEQIAVVTEDGGRFHGTEATITREYM